MKKLLPLALALVALSVFTGVGVAQEKASKEADRTGGNPQTGMAQERIETGVINTGETVDIERRIRNLDGLDGKENMKIVAPRDRATGMPSGKVNDAAKNTISSLPANGRVKAGLENAGSAEPAKGRGITINTVHPGEAVNIKKNKIDVIKGTANPASERKSGSIIYIGRDAE